MAKKQLLEITRFFTLLYFLTFGSLGDRRMVHEKPENRAMNWQKAGKHSGMLRVGIYYKWHKEKAVSHVGYVLSYKATGHILVHSIINIFTNLFWKSKCLLGFQAPV